MQPNKEECQQLVGSIPLGEKGGKELVWKFSRFHCLEKKAFCNCRKRLIDLTETGHTPKKGKNRININ
jgi:hypothetical protein